MVYRAAASLVEPREPIIVGPKHGREQEAHRIKVNCVGSNHRLNVRPILRPVEHRLEHRQLDRAEDRDLEPGPRASSSWRVTERSLMFGREFGGEVHHRDERLTAPTKLCRWHLRLATQPTNGLELDSSHS